MWPVSPVRRIATLDRRAVLAAPRLRRPGLTTVMLALSYSGTGPVWFGSTGLFIVLLRLGWTGIPQLDLLLGAMTAAFLSLVTGQVLKRLVRRPRPFCQLPDLATVGTRPSDLSMPSTHASTAVGLAVGLALYGHPLAPIVAPWAALVTFSRYYLGMHYPTDLLAGAALGAAFAIFDWRWLVHLLVFSDM